eukprot:1715943-Rhodomonas_salina.1
MSTQKVGYRDTRVPGTVRNHGSTRVPGYSLCVPSDGIKIACQCNFAPIIIVLSSGPVASEFGCDSFSLSESISDSETRGPGSCLQGRL